jgi:SAM-dependent methyltransferase
MTVLNPHQGLGNGRLTEELPRFSSPAVLLDAVYHKLLQAQIDDHQVNEDQVRAGMDDLFLGLTAHRSRASEAEWQDSVALCVHHSLKEMIHQDPFTQRAFTKPRGYAGDAKLLDYIYGREERWSLPDSVSPLGRSIFDYTTSAPAAAGVRARREFIANLLDDLAEEFPRPHVLSIAAGHLREALLSAAVKRRKLGRLVALDADKESLEEVARCYSYYGVEIIPASFRHLVTGKIQPGHFDLIYATGLLDYLAHNVARQLIWVLFQLLNPRGRLVVANFLPGIRDAGFMESYMDWKLIYRTRQEMLAVTELIPDPDIRDIRLFSEENHNILFLQVTRQ